MGIKQADALATDLAEEVANANQAVDCLTCADSSARTTGVLHWMNHEQASALMAEAAQTGDPQAFGRALHAVQDFFSHFGQGFVLETGEAGQDLYRDLLGQDDFDPSAHGGLDLETRIHNAADWGHSMTSVSPFTDFDPDEFVWDDEWDLLMVNETKDWIWLFLRQCFESNYGPVPEEEPLED